MYMLYMFFNKNARLVYPWLIQVDVWQKSISYCKATTLHSKKKEKNAKLLEEQTITKYVISFDPKFYNCRTGPQNKWNGAHRAFHLRAQATVKHTAKTTIRKQAINLGLMLTNETKF